MKCFNLMPADRRQAKACRTRMRQWLAPGAAFVGAMIMVCVVCHSTWGVGPDPHATQIRAAVLSIDASRSTVADLKKELVASQWKLDTFKGVGRQPDWSVLLALLADGLGRDVVLKRCELNEIAVPSPGSPSGSGRVKNVSLKEKGDDSQIAFALTVAGYGRSQTAVSQFVLRLERSGVFNNVRLVSTMREPFLNAKAIAFRLECSLEGTPAGQR